MLSRHRRLLSLGIRRRLHGEEYTNFFTTACDAVMQGDPAYRIARYVVHIRAAWKRLYPATYAKFLADGTLDEVALRAADGALEALANVSVISRSVSAPRRQPNNGLYPDGRRMATRRG
jgi:hypothetical protein